MTFVVKRRGGSAQIVAEYECPRHGRVTLTIDRDANGDPPAWAECPMPIGARDDVVLGLEYDRCNEPSEYRISAVRGRVRAGEVSRGKSEPPPHALALDTSPLADGMPYNEWKKKRNEMWRGERWKQIRETMN